MTVLLFLAVLLENTLLINVVEYSQKPYKALQCVISWQVDNNKPRLFKRLYGRAYACAHVNIIII